MAKITKDTEKFSREKTLPSQYNFDATMARAIYPLYGNSRKYPGAVISFVVSSLSAKVQKYIQNISSKCSMC